MDSTWWNQRVPTVVGGRLFESFLWTALAVIVLSACSASGSVELDQASEAASTVAPEAASTEAPDDVPSAAALDAGGLRADPVANALVAAQGSDPAWGTLIDGDELVLAHACAGIIVLAVLGEPRVREALLADGGLDVDALSSTEVGLVAQAIAPCHGNMELLRPLMALEDHQMTDCILDKVTAANQLPDLLEQLLDGVVIHATSSVGGFRFSCQTTALDELFGPHPGGTAGEDRRLVAEQILAAIERESQLTIYETACTTRGVMVVLPQDWVSDVVTQEPLTAVGAFEYLFTSTDEATIEAVFEAITTSLDVCVSPPFELFRYVADLDGSVSPLALGCLREELTDQQIAEALVWFGQATPIDATGSILGADEVFARCDAPSPFG